MTFKTLFTKTYLETKGINPLFLPLCFLVRQSLQNQKTHTKALFWLKILEFFRQDIVAFYQAEIDYFCGDFAKSLKTLNHFLSQNPTNADAIYLKATLLAFLGRKSEAFEDLATLLQISSRLKTWIILAKLTNNAQDFEKIRFFYEKYGERCPKFISHKDEILRRIANAGANAKAYEDSKAILKESLFLTLQKGSIQAKTKVAMRFLDAKVALEDLQDVFWKHSIEMFLISGVFLGVIRERNFIAHDYDIDVGIWQMDINNLREIFKKNPNFIVKNYDYAGGIQLYHRNGVYIDVFIHYEQNGLFYHDGDYLRWGNRPFTLAEYDFLGRKYLAPKDYDLYLRENYGEDYLTPKDSQSYHSFLDTPNMEVIDLQRYIILLYTLLLESSAHNEKRILAKLKELKEESFIQEYLNIKQGINL